MHTVDLMTALLTALGLSAACGLRVFLPPLLLALAAQAGIVTLDADLAWIGDWRTVAALAGASALELIGYCLPAVDNLLDMLTTPAAIAAGTLLSASVLGDVDPTTRWTLAAIAGGGSAGAIQASTVALRGLSTGLTGGVGNLLVAALEAVTAIALAVMAMLMPVASAILVGIMLIVLFRTVRRMRRRRAAASSPATLR